MENNEEIRKEDKIDVKAVFSKLVDEEPKELSQEEAIKNYTDIQKKKKTSNSEDDSTSNQEEEEHLKRIKVELLASLKRVDDMAKKIFVNKELRRKNILQNKDKAEDGVKNLQRDIHIENKTIERIKDDNEKTIE